jgi:hypothetical protein
MEMMKLRHKLVCNKQLNVNKDVPYWEVLNLYNCNTDGKNGKCLFDENGTIKSIQHKPCMRTQRNRTGNAEFCKDKRNGCVSCVALFNV